MSVAPRYFQTCVFEQRAGRLRHLNFVRLGFGINSMSLRRWWSFRLTVSNRRADQRGLATPSSDIQSGSYKSQAWHCWKKLKSSHFTRMQIVPRNVINLQREYNELNEPACLRIIVRIVSAKQVQLNTRMIVEGTRGPFYTIGRFSFRALILW